jgi:myo-inositol 2-dehydrogenase/D-chiro-inositol 1-dehydrogenase
MGLLTLLLLGLLSLVVSSSSPSPSSLLRVGVIGTGCIGIEHLRNLHLCDAVRIVAVADNFEPSRASAVACLRDLGIEEGVHVLDNYDALLDSPTVDAVVVCTPNDHHIEVLRAAFRTGKHLLVEKPLCTDVAACAEAEALAEAACAEARAAGRKPPVLWCGMEYRYIPTIARLLRDANAGAVGELRMLTIREHRFPFLRKVGDWNRFTARTGGTLVEKCCHHFDLMRLILRAEPVRFLASGGQDVNHLHEQYEGRPSDILDNAYVLVDFDNGARALLELCMCDLKAPRHATPARSESDAKHHAIQPPPAARAIHPHAFGEHAVPKEACCPPARFAEASKHQEEVSLVGTHGKLEAFAPSHGLRTDDASVVNYRRGVRNPAFAKSWDRHDPPPPEECGQLSEEHVGVEARLLEAGNHCGATYEEVNAFADAALQGRPPTVTLSDGSKAVLMGLAAHRAIETGQPVLWSDMLREFEEARAEAALPLNSDEK